MITRELLKEVVNYNADTGIFTREKSINKKLKKGDDAGYLASNGYIRINIDGKEYAASILAWLYVYGILTSKIIDHKNGITNDNRIKNLREVTHQQNMKNRKIHKNNKSGMSGVRWVKARGKWTASIGVNGKTKQIGSFDERSDAIKARLKEEKKHKYFIRKCV